MSKKKRSRYSQERCSNVTRLHDAEALFDRVANTFAVTQGGNAHNLARGSDSVDAVVQLHVCVCDVVRRWDRFTLTDARLAFAVLFRVA